MVKNAAQKRINPIDIIDKSADPKQQVTLRLDSVVLEKFRATGPGWQSRINAELRKVLGL